MTTIISKWTWTNYNGQFQIAPENRDCAICFDPLIDRVVYHLGQSNIPHSFHKECLARWDAVSLRNGCASSCPTCRDHFVTQDWLIEEVKKLGVVTISSFAAAYLLKYMLSNKEIGLLSSPLP